VGGDEHVADYRLPRVKNNFVFSGVIRRGSNDTVRSVRT